MPYLTGDPLVFGSDDPKAGALVLSTDLATFPKTSTDPIRMFAYRDAFRTVAEAKARALAALPWNLYERDDQNGRRKLGEEEDRLAAAIANPTPTVTPFRFTEALALDMTLHDRWAFLPLVMDNGALKTVRLPASRISFAVDELLEVTHVVIHGGKRMLPIPIELVVYDVGYDPNPSGKDTIGYSISNTLEAAATELERGAYYRAKLLAGGPKVPMYIKRPKDAPAWDKNGGRTRFIDDFKSYSAEAAGGVPILEDGMELAAAPQLVADSVQYKETRLAAQIEFAIAMHFPPELIGYRAGTNSNLEALREQLYVDVLGSDIAAYRQALNLGYRRTGYLLPTRYVEENLGARLAASPDKQATLLQTQVGAPVRTVNEARRILNLPMVDGGDDLIVPLNVTKGGLASPTDTGPKALGFLRSRSLKSIEQGRTPAQYKALEQKVEERFAADLAKAFARQGKRVSAVLGDGDSPGSLEDAFNRELEDAELASVIYPHSVALAKAGAAPVLAKWNPDEENYDEEVMYPWLAKAAQGNAAAINSGIFDALAAAVVGSSWATAVEDLYSRYSADQAGVWATTIGTTSLSFGASDAAKASGLTQKTWRQSASQKPRAEHSFLDGETVDAGDLFSNGMRWPGDPVGGADQNANCHCRVEYSRADS